MRKAIISLGDRRRHGSHPGLILERYLCRQADPDDRRRLLDATAEAARSDSLRSIYTEAFARWRASFPQGGVSATQELVTASRLVIGLGGSNVLETGLRLHHTYGVPIIPGSALKGLASHYCHDVWGRDGDEAAPEENRPFRRGGDYHSLLFGTTEDGGTIAFHDALITPASLTDGALKLDVMTPHHRLWQLNAAAPTDMDSPVPVSFLSVAASFEIRLSWSGPRETPPDRAQGWAALTMKLLSEALAEWGIGGKTRSGYGRLVPPGSSRGGRPTAVAAPAKQVVLPSPGALVDGQLLAERTKKGGWKALHAASGLSGAIQNSPDVPPDKNVGDFVKLIVASANERELAFRFQTDTEAARAQRPSGGGKGFGGPTPGRRRT